MKNDFVSLSESMAGGGSHLTACGHDEVRDVDHFEAKPKKDEKEEQKRGRT